MLIRPVERGGQGEICPGPATFGGPLSLKNIKYIRLCHSKKQNWKIFWGDTTALSVGPVALDIPDDEA